MLRLKEIMREKGITGKDLAEKVELSTTSMSAIVSGQSFPRSETLKLIADALDVDIRDLFESTKAGASEFDFTCPNCGTRLKVDKK